MPTGQHNEGSPSAEGSSPQATLVSVKLTKTDQHTLPITSLLLLQSLGDTTTTTTLVTVVCVIQVCIQSHVGSCSGLVHFLSLKLSKELP